MRNIFQPVAKRKCFARGTLSDPREEILLTRQSGRAHFRPQHAPRHPAMLVGERLVETAGLPVADEIAISRKWSRCLT